MNIIYDYYEFESRVRPLSDLDFALLDIVPDTQLGFFRRERYQELLEYCEANPDFHIISTLRDSLVRVNAPLEFAGFYMLGQGDKNPKLVHAFKTTEDHYIELCAEKLWSRSTTS